VNSIRGLATTALLLALTACAAEITGAASSPGADDPQPGAGPAPGEAPIRTSASEYTLVRHSHGLQVQIPFVFTNRTGGTVYVVNCNGATSLELQRWQNGAWVTVWTPVLAMCLSPPITIARGAEHRSGVHVWAGDRGSNTYPQFTMDEIAGEYRIRWGGVYSDYDSNRYPFGTEVPEAQRVSNTFRLRTP
jgi:hypothetical protein